MAYPKPSDEDIRKVVKLADALREKGQDRANIGLVLHYLIERNRKLEDLRNKAEYYVRFGQGESELTALRLALEKLRQEDIEDADDSSFFARE